MDLVTFELDGALGGTYDIEEVDINPADVSSIESVHRQIRAMKRRETTIIHTKNGNSHHVLASIDEVRSKINSTDDEEAEGSE